VVLSGGYQVTNLRNRPPEASYFFKKLRFINCLVCKMVVVLFQKYTAKGGTIFSIKNHVDISD